MSIVEEKGANVIINLKMKDGSQSALIKELQRDILTQTPMHIDFPIFLWEQFHKSTSH